MANPLVTLGITTFTFSDTTTGFNDYVTGQGFSAEADYYVQKLAGSSDGSMSRTISNARKGMYYNTSGITPARFSAGEHLYVWMYLTGFPATLSVSQGGVTCLVTNGTSNVTKQFYVDGNENTVGGWRCYPFNPSNTADLTENSGGTQGANLGVTLNVTGVGGICDTSGTQVGKANFAVDALRIGTGLTISRGDTSIPAGFSTVTEINDDVENAYGVFAATGSGAEIQGDLSIGLDDTTTDTYFDDSNFVIVNPNKNPRFGTTNTTLSDFTGITIQGGLTTCLLSNVSFISADPYDKGYFESGTATNDPARVELDGCTFQNWGPTTLSGLTTATNTTWINCEAITLNSGTLDQCTVETGIGGTYVFSGSTPDNISNVSFIGGGTGGGHGLEITASGSYDFVNNSFSNFGGSDGDDAAIHVNGAGVDVTLNISGNDATTAPTYKLTGAGATITYVTAVTVNVTGLPVVPAPQDATEIRVLVAGQDLFATSVGIGTTDPSVGIGTESHRTDTFTFSITKDFDFDLRIINLDYEPQFISSIRSTLDPTNVAANLKLDRVSQNEKQ